MKGAAFVQNEDGAQKQDQEYYSNPYIVILFLVVTRSFYCISLFFTLIHKWLHKVNRNREEYCRTLFSSNLR